MRTGITLALTLAIASACGGDGPGAKEAKATRGKALKVMPEDTKVLIGVNLAKARKSKYWKDLEKAIADDEEGAEKLAKFEKACGLKPLEAVTSVVLGMNAIGGRKGDEEESEKPTVVVSGAFDRATVKTCMEKLPEALGTKGKVTEDGEVLRFDEEGDDEPLVTYWLDDKTVMVTAEKDVAKVKELGGGKGKGPAKGLLDLAGKANGGAALWVAMVIDSDMKSGMGRMPVPMPIPDGVWASLEIGDGLSAELGLHYEKSEDAKKAAEQAEGLWKMAKNQEEAKEFVTGVNVNIRQSGNDVLVSVSVSGATVDKFYKMALEGGDDEDRPRRRRDRDMDMDKMPDRPKDGLPPGITPP